MMLRCFVTDQVLQADHVSPPRPPRHPRRPSSTHLPMLPDPGSPAPSSQTSSPRLPSRISLHRKMSSSISRSSSSSSVPGLGVVPEGVAAHGLSTSNSSRVLSGQRLGRHESPNGSHDDRQEYLISPSPAHSRNGAVSPRKAHQRSPSLPVEASTSRPTYRSRASHASGSGNSDRVVEEEDQDELDRRVRSPVGTTLDDRIREAEEKIKQSTQKRRPRTSDANDAGRPGSTTLRRHDSYHRNSNNHSPSAYTSSTLRRSATLSSASVLTPNGDQGSDSSNKRYTSTRHTTAGGGGAGDSHEREYSGGSGSSGRRKPIPTDFRNGGLFTPSPKSPMTNLNGSEVAQQPSTSQRRSRLTQSPEDTRRYSPAQRYNTVNASPAEQTHTSPLDRVRAARNTGIDGLPRTSTSSAQGRNTYDPVKRHYHESLSGLPKPSEVDMGGSYARAGGASVRRAESVLGTAGDRYRYQKRGGSAESAFAQQRYGESAGTGTASRSSRHALGPGDSVSVVGGYRAEGPSPAKKDPLEVIRRMEQSRAEHQKQWESERSASVMGDASHNHGGNAPYPRPSSRLFDATPRHARPSTSMANMRHLQDMPAPRTAPIDDWRSRRDQAIAIADSPLVNRAGNRLSNVPTKPATEPRPLRSSTSMGSRLDMIDTTVPETEHGRLLFEACRALELKLGPELLEQIPELAKTLQSSARSAESVNSSIRNIVRLADNANVHLDLEDTERARDELARLTASLRDANRASDQNIRDLTRVLLDLPKLVRQVDRASAPSRALHRPSMEFDRRPSPVEHSAGRFTSRYDGSPARASHDMIRPATSMGEATSPLHRFSLDSSRRPILQPRSQPRDRDRDRSSAVSNLVAKMRGLTPRTSPLPKHSDLQPIEQSPPNLTTDRVPSLPSSRSRSSLALSASPTKSSQHSTSGPAPPPRSPERRNVLRKKASATSTHTVRGSSSFLPSSSRVRTTTAISTISAGNFDFDTELTPAKSIRSTRTMSTSEEMAGSPSSRYSFGMDGNGGGSDGGVRGSMDSTASAGQREDAVSVLEHSLAAAAKKREDEDRRPSVSERFRATLRRGGSVRSKE